MDDLEFKFEIAEAVRRDDKAIIRLYADDEAILQCSHEEELNSKIHYGAVLYKDGVEIATVWGLVALSVMQALNTAVYVLSELEKQLL